LSISKGRTQDLEAKVSIEFNSMERIEVSRNLFGNFIEYYMCFQNGHSGLWAQEFRDRGFDIKHTENGTSDVWEKWGSYYNSKDNWQLIEGGFNENALYFQRIFKENTNNIIGIRQKIYTTVNQGFDIYVYLKGDTTVENVKVLVMDENLTKLLAEISLGKPDSIWKKFSGKLPAIQNHGIVNIIFGFQGKGVLDLDECSIMPENNINGIRNEFYNLYNEWKPGILRYPGGWFIEYSGYSWDMAVGNIDKRKVLKGFENVRMDFGIDEFLQFCEFFKITPHLVTNYIKGTPEESAALVEYCNGEISSHFGKKRKLNGHEEPYNVQIWEIGNEIWDDPLEYGKGFTLFNKKMKEKDPKIKTMISADIWQWRNFFFSVIDNIGSDCDYYGWHWTQIGIPKVPASDEEIFLSMVGGSIYFENNIDTVYSWLNSSGYSETMNQAITELWTVYNPDGYEWDLDTTKRGASLENGLWMATQINSCIRKSKYIDILERTFSVGTFRMEIEKNTGRRHYYKTPSHLVGVMISNHIGNKLLQTNVESEKYSLPFIDGLMQPINVPWIDVTTTVSADSLYINIVNRNPNNEIITLFNFDFNLLNKLAKIYELYSPSFLDYNSISNPENIKIIEKSWTVTNSYTVPAHSFTILAIPCKGIINVDDSTNDDKMDFHLYPNPVVDLLSIDADFKLGNVKIYNLLGSLVLSDFVEDNKVKINLSFLASGLYIAEINNIRKLLVKK